MIILLRIGPYLTALLCCGLLGGCASNQRASYQQPEPEYALPAQPDGAFAEMTARITAKHGMQTSGFKLLDSNRAGLDWRLALIDSAQQSLDVQYYLWYGDASGGLLISRLLEAADRGVKVRLLVDDLNSVLDTASWVTLRDRVLAWLDAHPNIELRLFNPWSNRQILQRVPESFGNITGFNQRMHNKSLIVDNRAVIIGGRNVGDEYLGLNADFNFHDLDVLAIGAAAPQASEIFDNYWNSQWVLPVAALELPITREEQLEGRRQLAASLADTDSLASFGPSAQVWDDEIAALEQELHVGVAVVVADMLRQKVVERNMYPRVTTMMAEAKSELLIANAYIIPAELGIERLEKLGAEGVAVKILTNSLASHDVAAVNSHYKKWRRPILEAGARLYEMRHDPAIAKLYCDTPPVSSRFIGLHSKAMVVDRERVYIGSMNLDPRSAQLNTEMGIFIESRGLGEALAALMERDMQPENSWQVTLGPGARLVWSHDSQRTERQPARHWWQRVEDVFFMAFPKELY